MNIAVVKKIVGFAALAVAAVGLNVACDSDDIVQNLPDGSSPNDMRVSGMPMKFGIKEFQSRTAYYVTGGVDDMSFADGLGIKWTDGDNVRVFCDQAKGKKKSSKYNIINIKQPNGTSAEMTANGGELVFDDNASTKHNIHAVYPGDSTKVSNYNNGIVKLKLNQSQNKEWGTKNNLGRYEIPYDMTDLYMVAAKPNQVRAAEVDLRFEPIMSTARVIINNQRNDGKPVEISGVTISHSNTGKFVKDGCIQYNCVTGELVPFADADPMENVTYNIELRQGGSNFLSLNTNEVIDFTFFLPPFPAEDITVANPIDIYVRSTEGRSRNVQVKTLKAKAKTRIDIGVGAQQTPDEWIKYIEDNVYVSQLSIPGVGYAGTSSGAMSNPVGSFKGYAIQGYNTSKLWDYGCRAFDFHGESSLKARIGGASIQDESIFDILDVLTNKLKVNKEEFAIVFVRQEFGLTTSGMWETLRKNYWDLQKYGTPVKFRPDLTVGELRGKILLIALEWGYKNIPMLSGRIPTANWPNQWSSGTCYNEKNIKTDCKITNGDEKQTATMMTQERLNLEQNTPLKIDMCCDLLKLTAATNKSADKANVWSFNALYGCDIASWSSNNFARGQGYFMDVEGKFSSYGSTYSSDNVYSYFMKSQTWGPCGIILQGFTGMREAGFSTLYPVYGDFLTQAIIDRNFTNKLLKKTK